MKPLHKQVIAAFTPEYIRGCMATVICEQDGTPTGAYNVYYKNRVFLGRFYREVDGFYVFDPDIAYVFDPDIARGGYWDGYVLLGIAGHLERINARWKKTVDRDLSKLEKKHGKPAG